MNNQQRIDYAERQMMQQVARSAEGRAARAEQRVKQLEAKLIELAEFSASQTALLDQAEQVVDQLAEAFEAVTEQPTIININIQNMEYNHVRGRATAVLVAA